MPSREATIASTVGLHARPASLFVARVADCNVPVKIGKEGHPAVDAKSLISVMTLGARHGDVVTLSAEGEGADEALDELVAFLQMDHDAS